MKKIILIMLLTMFSTMFGQSVGDIFTSNEIVWFGLDFSNAKMIGKGNFGTGQEIIDKYIPAWNYVINKERNKYDLNEVFRKEKVIYDLSVVEKVNTLIDPNQIITNKPNKIESNQIKDIISQYDLRSYDSGIGLVFIIESFDKYADLGTMYVVFFNISTKEVLLLTKMSGKCGGFGKRNYWIRTVYNVLEDIEDDVYEIWKSKYISE